MASPVFQAINGTGASPSGVQTAVPASIVSGNLLISMCIWVSGTVNTISVAAGYTIIQQINIGAFRAAIAFRVATGTTGNSPTWTWTGGGNCASNVSRYTGNTSTPIGASSANAGTGTAAAGTQISAQAAASTFLCDIVTDNAQTIPNPTGYTSKSTNTTAPSERTTNKNTVSVGDLSTTAAVTITSADWIEFLVELQSTAPPPTESGSAAQTLKLITQSLTGKADFVGTAAQVLKLITQAATGKADYVGTAAQTLKLVTQSLTGNATGIIGTISQTLKLVTQSASGWQEIFGTAAQTLKLVTQSLAGNSIFGTAAQTLKRITQSAVGQQWTTGPIVQTLKLVRQSAQGWQEIFGAAAQTLKLVTQHVIAASSAGIHGTITQTLKLIRQSGIGQQWTTGPIVQTLKLVRQSAQGWHKIFGTAVQLLFRPQQLLNGFELTLDTLFAVSKVQLNAVVAAIEKQIRSTWHGPPDDPLPPLV